MGIDEVFGRTPAQQPQAPRSRSGGLVSGIAAVLIGAALCWFAMSAMQDSGKQDKQQDKQEQKDDKRQDSDVAPVKEAAGYLLFLHERTKLTEAQANMLTITAEYCEQNKKLSWRSFDIDDPNEKVQEAVAFAKSNGVQPPCLVYKDADNKHRKAIAYPATLPEMLKVLQ